MLVAVPVALAALWFVAGAGAFPPDRISFTVIKPRVGISSYFALTGGTSNPGRLGAFVAIRRVDGQPCTPTAAGEAADPVYAHAAVSGTSFGFYRKWTPTRPGRYLVCSWLAPSDTTSPAVATNGQTIVVAPRSRTRLGIVLAASTSASSSGPARNVFGARTPRIVERFALGGLPRRRVPVTILSRSPDGFTVVSLQRSSGASGEVFATMIPGEVIRTHLGYWTGLIRVAGHALGRVRFLVPDLRFKSLSITPTRIPRASQPPAVKGQTRAGYTLDCFAGWWTAGGRLTIQWLRNGKPVTGARRYIEQYRTHPADAGARFQCRVSVHSTLGTGVATSAPVVIKAAG